MTRQEAVREGIKYACRCGNCQDGYVMYQDKKIRKCYQCYKGYKLDVDAIIKYLHSQDVVLKVGRKLPEVETYCQLARAECIPKLAVQSKMIEAGYVAVEPLIKEQ